MEKNFGLVRGLSFTLLLAASGCLPSIDDLNQGPLNKTFAVSDYFTPSGFMGDGASFGHLYLDVNTNCKQPRPANAQGNCYTFTYYRDTSPTAYGWAGVYWVYPANNWGTRPGHAIDFTKFQQIRYSAAIEYPPVPPGVDLMGAVPEPPNEFYGNINMLTYQDVPQDKIFPKVTSELTPFFIPFPNGQTDGIVADGSIIGAFGWSIAYPSWANPADPLVIHFDDIVWDTAAPPPSVTP
jgi:hypothetical protein